MPTSSRDKSRDPWRDDVGIVPYMIVRLTPNLPLIVCLRRMKSTSKSLGKQHMIHFVGKGFIPSEKERMNAFPTSSRIAVTKVVSSPS